MSDTDEDEDELRDFDPTKEGGKCERCGAEMPPWRFAKVCGACAWDINLARRCGVLREAER